MSEAELEAKTDPELLRQLNTPSSSDEQIVAVVRLRSDDPSQIVPLPEQTEQITEKVLRRVHSRVGGETRHNVFKNLGYFVVSADKSFLRELIAQPEVARAIANEQPRSASIAPVKKRAVPPLHPKKRARAAKKVKSPVAARKTSAKAVK